MDIQIEVASCAGLDLDCCREGDLGIGVLDQKIGPGGRSECGRHQPSLAGHRVRGSEQTSTADQVCLRAHIRSLSAGVRGTSKALEPLRRVLSYVLRVPVNKSALLKGWSLAIVPKREPVEARDNHVPTVAQQSLA